MLQANLIRPASLALLLVAAVACGGDDGGGAIEDNLIRPGITAIDQASALACSSDAETIRQSIEQYRLLEGAPPADEATLVAERFLRSESELHDIVDGQVVAVDPGCGAVSTITAPSTDVGEIVTATDAPVTPEQMLAELADDEIAQVGGIACATELVTIFTASQEYVAEQGRDPETLDELLAAGYLDDPIELWSVVDKTLVPVPGSGCVDLDTADAATACASEARTLAVARQAHFSRSPGGSEPTQADLVVDGYLRAPSEIVDLVDGVVVAVPGGPCEGVDLDD